MSNFLHFNGESMTSACEMLKAGEGRIKPVAGGSDLITVLKAGILPTAPEALLNLKTIPGCNGIHEEEGSLHIGALVLLRDIAACRLLNEKYSALAEAADKVASPQIRNVGTLGGNLCQDTRCWYYRYPAKLGGGPLDCPRKSGKGACLAIRGDNRYHAIMNGRRCFAVCPSDTAVALAAYDAKLHICGTEGERCIPASEFYHPLGNGLAAGELVREVEIPSENSRFGQCFVKYAHRKSIDFALVSVAAVVAAEDGVFKKVRIAIGAVAPGPVRPLEAESFLEGKSVCSDTVREAAERALSGATPLSMNGYKVDTAKALVKQAVLTAAARLGTV